MPGKHSKAVYHEFLKEGKLELAKKIEHLLTSELPKSAYTEQQYQIAKRKDVDLANVREIVSDCYSRSDNYPSLLAAMNEQGLSVEQGTKTLIVKNQDGTELGSLQKLLMMKKMNLKNILKKEIK